MLAELFISRAERVSIACADRFGYEEQGSGPGPATTEIASAAMAAAMGVVPVGCGITERSNAMAVRHRCGGVVAATVSAARTPP